MTNVNFISFKGLDNEMVTVNLNYLIKFEPIPNNRTKIYIDDKTATVTYNVTIAYVDLVNQINKLVSPNQK